MPYVVQLPDGRSVEFPDNIPPEEAERIIRRELLSAPSAPVPGPIQPVVIPETTIAGQVAEAFKGVPRGAIGLLESAATGAGALLPDEAEAAFRRSVGEFFSPAREALAPEAGYEESVVGKATEALGSTLPFLATGPLGLAGRAIVGGGLGAAAGAGEARLRAEAGEATEDDRGLATLLGAGVGISEMFPIVRILDRLPGKETLTILDQVKRAAAAGGEELAQEASAAVAQNLIERGVYNPDKDILQGAAEEGAYGFGVGAFIQGLTDLAIGRRVRGGAGPQGVEDADTRTDLVGSIEGADTGSAPLPLPRVGAAGPDLEGIEATGMGLPSRAVEQPDAGEEALQPALRFQRGEEEPEIKTQTVYRGGSQSTFGLFPKDMTADDVIRYEIEELGNEDSTQVMPGIDLKSIPARNLDWVTFDEASAQRYADPDLGETVESREETFRVIAKDDEGGYLIQRLPQPKFQRGAQKTVDELEAEIAALDAEYEAQVAAEREKVSEVESFARRVAENAIANQNNYEDLEESIDFNRDNIRESLKENIFGPNSTRYEEQAFAAYDAEVNRLQKGKVATQRGEVPITPQVAPERVQEVVKETISGWTNPPSIVVAKDVNDPVIPPQFRGKIPADARGFYSEGNVFVLADRAPSEAAVKGTVFHESLGHYGLSQLYGKRLNEVLGSIYKTNPAIRRKANEWLKQNPEVYNKLRTDDMNSLAVEEVLAAASEAGPIKDAGVRAAFKRVAAMIRNFLRGMGFVGTYSDNDVAQILRQSSERVTKKKQYPIAPPDAAPKFQISQSNKILNAVSNPNAGRPKWSPQLGVEVGGALSDLNDSARRAQYKIYSMPMMGELLERIAPRVKAIDALFGIRAAYTTNLMRRSSNNHAGYTKVVEEVKKSDPQAYDKLVAVAADINLYQVPVRALASFNAKEKQIYDNLMKLVANVDSKKTPLAKLDPQDRKNYEVVKKFRELDPRLQDVIVSKDGKSGIYGDYRSMSDEKLDIFMKVYGGKLGSGVVRELREVYERDRLIMYAPLTRGTGNYWLSYEDANGQRVSTNFNSDRARRKGLEEAIAQGAKPDTVEMTSRQSDIRGAGQPPAGFLGSVISNLEARIDAEGIDPAAKDNILKGAYEAFIDSLPSDSLRMELSKRKRMEDTDGVVQFGVMGFDKDVLDVYDKTMPRMAYQLGNLRYSLPIENTLKKAAEQIETYKQAIQTPQGRAKYAGAPKLSAKAAQDAIDDIRGRVQFSYNPTYAPWVNAIASGNYIYSIAGNVSSALINITTVPMLTIPSLIAKHGFAKTISAIGRASKMYAQGGVDSDGNFTFGNTAQGQYKRFFNLLMDRSIVGASAEQELRQAQDIKIKGIEGLTAKANFALGYVFKNSERFNREVTLLSSFMLETESGKNFKEAADEAIRLNNNINGTVLPEAASRLYQTNLGRVLLTFRTFALTQMINIGRAFNDAVRGYTPEERAIARRKLLGIYGFTYMMAGVKGMPLFGAAEVLASLLMGDDDEPYDLQQEVLESMGSLGLNGPVNEYMNLDIASRTGFNGLLWRDDPKRLAEVGYTTYILERLGGPTFGLLQNAERSIKLFGEGEIWRGIEAGGPIAPIRAGFKAVRYATEGALTKDGLPIKEDIGSWNVAMQVLGFAPADLALEQAQVGALYQVSDKIRNRRTAILTKYYTAMKAGDATALDEAMASVTKFNDANPEYMILPSTIRASFRERMRRDIEAINGVYLPANLRMTADKYVADYNLEGEVEPLF